RILARTIRARQELEAALQKFGFAVKIVPTSETNILCFAIVNPGEPISASNQRTLKIYHQFSAQVDGEFYLSMTRLSRKSYGQLIQRCATDWDSKLDTDELVLLRA